MMRHRNSLPKSEINQSHTINIVPFVHLDATAVIAAQKLHLMDIIKSGNPLQRDFPGQQLETHLGKRCSVHYSSLERELVIPAL